MKVGIMTWFKYHNFGTALQAYALYRVLEKNGFSASLVNYEDDRAPVVLNDKNIIKYYFCKFKAHINFRNLYRDDVKDNKFEIFLCENIKLTKKCETLSDLEGLNEAFDAFICGSDQIWAPSVFNPRYYLDFVTDNNKKIAYAPSLGLSKIKDENIKKRMTELISKFTYISTREKSGSKIIADLIGRDVETVLDPTLLINAEEWSEISEAACIENEPYVLVYMLGKNEKHWKKIYKIANKLKLCVKIIPIYKKDIKREGCIREPVGPKEFISLISNAGYICTDSFHGMLFSINFCKPFCVFERFKKNDEMNQNSRVYNILEILNLQSRLVSDEITESLFEIIDYDAVNTKLKFEKKKSIKYLVGSLKSISKDKEKNNVFDTNSLCCGCGACQLVCPVNAISVEMNQEGFYSAAVNEKACISCGKCKKVCPYLSKEEKKCIKDAELYSYIDNEKEVLLHSSSGGMAYRIAEKSLENGATVVGCCLDCAEHKAKHIIILEGQKNKLLDLQGSKYLQSEYVTAMSQIKDINTPIVIFGTPCQIAGARKLYSDKKNVIYVDLICHGVPTYKLYTKYLQHLEKFGINSTDDVKTVFRYKPKGWRKKYIYNKNATTEYCKCQNKDMFYLFFEHGLCYSKTCYECLWRDKSEADIRLGDYWHKKYAKNKTGVSMVIALNQTGKEYIYNMCEDTGVLKKESVEHYFDCQQTTNYRKPAFWEELIYELDSESDLRDIMSEYVYPFEKRKKVGQLIHKLKGALKLYEQKK